jgi:acyl-CoA synthetase (AMP-forming)/AMP-acid ligase II
MMTIQFATLVDLTRQRAQTQTDDTAYTFLLDGEADTAKLTYAELDRRARAIAASLQQWNAAGERALLIYPPGLDYIAAFLGCLYAGVVAVPTYPPRLNRPDPRLQTILVDSQATIALTTGSILASLERRFEHTPDLASLHWLNTEQVDVQRSDQWAAPTLRGDADAWQPAA